MPISRHMTRRPLFLPTRGFALWLLLLLGACSAVSIGYGNAPTLLSWRAAEYFDLDADQRVRFRERLEGVHEWHRREELPRLLADLEEAGRRLDRPVSVEDAEWLVTQVQEGYRRVVGRIIDESAELLVTLSPEQIAELERRFAEQGAEFEAEWVDAPPERIREARYERVLEQVEAWMGRLEPAQREWLQDRLDAMPVDYRSWRTDRERREAELISLLQRIAGGARPVATVPPYVAQVLRWALDWNHGRSPEQQAQAKRLRREYMQLGVDLVNRASPEQRERIRSRLGAYLSGLSSALE